MSAAVVAVVVGALAFAGTTPWRTTARAADRRVSAFRDGRSIRTDVRAAPEHPDPVDVTCLLELVGAAVRSGAGVPRALEAVGTAVGGPDGRSLGRAAAALRLGAGWESAWAAAGTTPAESDEQPRCPPRLDLLRRALRGAWDDGAAPGEALRAAAAEHRHERRAAARTAAARLAVRLVLPLGICYLPAFVLVGLVPVLLALGLDLLSG